jgi:signal peptidase I
MIDWKKKASSFWRNYARPFLFIFIVLTAFRSSVADWNDVPTGSMKPTILEGDRIFVNKLAYDLKVPYTTWRLAHWGEPERGDVVVFYSPEDGTRLVKRVVAAAGDTIELRNEQLIINGQEANYEPIDEAIASQLPDELRPNVELKFENVGGESHPVMTTPNAYAAARSFGPITIPDGHFFMMGDNRDNSRDSRYFGAVPRKLILGKASAVAVSVDVNNYFWPRWGRFFSKLP